MGVEDSTLKVKKKFGVVIRIIGVFLVINKTRKYKTQKMVSKKEGSKDMPFSFCK